MKFWAVLGSRGCREKKTPRADYEQLFGVVFLTFCGQKKKKKNRVCLTEKLHRKKVKKINIFFGKSFIFIF